MDVKAYIESGILEQYVLGKLSSAEEHEVAYYAALYPEIQHELNQIELALERYAQLAGKEPPPGVMDDILQKINTRQKTSAPATGDARERTGWSKTLSSGIIIALLLAVAGLLYVLFRNQTLQSRLDAQRQEQEAAQAACDRISDELNLLQEELRFLKDPETQPIVLNSTGLTPDARADIYLNPQRQQVYLSKLNLPPPPPGKQYQLWAIVDGQPASMGVFDLPADPSTLIEVPYVREAEAFAISLENTGGSEQPTEGQIYVLGAA